MQHHKHPLRRVLLMAVCARPVGVLMTVFFSRRIADDRVKMKGSACQGVIALHRDLAVCNVDHRHQARPPTSVPTSNCIPTSTPVSVSHRSSGTTCTNASLRCP